MFLIGKGAQQFDCGMNMPAKDGDREAVDFFIEKGANKWAGGLYMAEEGGHVELVKFFREKYETYYQ